MGLDDNIPVRKLRKDVLMKVCSSIEKFGWEKFQQHIPSDWCLNEDTLNYNSLQKLKVSVNDLVEVLCKLQIKEAMSVLVSFMEVSICEDLPKDVRVPSGGTLSLECKAQGIPSPNFKWYRRVIGQDEMSLIEGQTCSVLCIENFKKSDVGFYACKAYNFNKNNGKKFKAESSCVSVLELTDYSNDEKKPVRKEPVIVKNPVGHTKVNIGASVILEVLAEGEEPLLYEWFKEGQPIKCSNENKLEFHYLMPELEDRSWTYQCLVSNDYGKIMSDPAVIRLAKKSIKTIYHAEDKVALLIGNGRYKHIHPLASPVEDVTTLATQLRSENFKVIALHDLDLVEMKNAIKYFCMLLDKGVYGFFYFAGHGFEHNNQKYMQPVNALDNYSMDASLCAEFVHAEMEKKKPRLAALLFDMCRTERERTKSVVGEQMIVYKPDPHPNFIIAFATIFQKRAYETQGLKNGVFVSHLKNYINQKLSIQTVIDKVIADVNADPVAGKYQHPSTYKALPDDYSLTDQILIEDEKAARFRNEIFNRITVCPNGIFGPLPGFSNVTLDLRVTKYRGCILNGVDIIVELICSDPNVRYFPHIRVENKTFCTEEMPVKHNETMFGISIFALQKLRENILATLSIKSEQMDILNVIELDLGMPFIMSANLSESDERSKPVEEDSWTET